MNVTATNHDEVSALLTVTLDKSDYKDNVENLNDISSAFMKLRPVSFHYKADEHKTPQYGLIAEEVEALFPDLVVYDEQGQPETLQYHQLYALLIKMIQENRKLILELQQARS